MLDVQTHLASGYTGDLKSSGVGGGDIKEMIEEEDEYEIEELPIEDSAAAKGDIQLKV